MSDDISDLTMLTLSGSSHSVNAFQRKQQNHSCWCKRRAVIWLVSSAIPIFALTSGVEAEQAAIVPVPVAAAFEKPAIGAIPADRQLSATSATRQLSDNALFWAEKGRAEISLHELDRLVGATLGSPDALALAALLAFQLQRFDRAERYRAMLQDAAPNDPRMATLNVERKLSDDDQKKLSEARTLAAGDDKDAAIKIYEATLGGKVPDSIATEYYIALGTASPEGFETASRGLLSVSARWPNNPLFKLAYAQLQTYQEDARDHGIDLLRDLASTSSVALAAQHSWRAALLWQSGGRPALDQIDGYLSKYPSDPEIDAKRKDIQDKMPDEALLARLRAYEAKRAGRMAEAEAHFLDALQHDPDDSESMIMLSNFRRGQNRVVEADKLVARAMELDPDRRDEFVIAIGFDPASHKGASQNSASVKSDLSSQHPFAVDVITQRKIVADYAQVGILSGAGRYDEAERLLRIVVDGRWNAGLYLQLGFIQKGAGHLAEAEQSFRHAMTAEPNSGDATLALGDLLANLARFGEADELYERARQLYAEAHDTVGLQKLHRNMAERLRAAVRADEDPVRKIDLYRVALAVDPSDAWLRLDLADSLRKQRRYGEARQIMADGVSDKEPDPEALQAAIVFAEQSDSLVEAKRLILRLPEAQRSPQMRADLEILALQEQIRQAVVGATPQQARSQILTLAAQPDPTGMRGFEIGRALMKLKDMTGARRAIATALANTPSVGPQQRLAYSAILLEAGALQDAANLLAGAQSSQMSVLDHNKMEQLENNIAVHRADELNEEGRTADGIAVLRLRLQSDPDNVDLNLGLSRLYQKTGKIAEAMCVNDAMLKRHPTDVGARLSSFYAAMQNGDQNRASQLVNEGIGLFPDAPSLYAALADFERSQGAYGAALSDLIHARDLRQKQLASGAAAH